MPTPANMPQRKPGSAHTRASLDAVISTLAESIEADSNEIDLDAITTLTRLTDATARFTDAQARFVEAFNQRHAQRKAAGQS